MSLRREMPRFTPEEYLERERRSDVRHEYLDGQIYEMAGESLNHSQICINLAREVSLRLKGTRCQALSPNMKVRAQTRGFYAYPDLTIVCGEPLFDDERRDVLLNPKVIFEVLSPSTAAYDRVKKFTRYRAEIASFSDYVLVAQDEMVVEHYEKQADGRWVYAAYTEISETVKLASIDCELAMREIYDRVLLEEATLDASVE